MNGRDRTLHYRSVEDLNRTVIEWSRRLPADFDLIVGVPRSGLLAASLLGLHMHRPVVDLSSFLANADPWSGFRLPSHRASRRVLILDDSVDSGREMARVRAAVGNRAATQVTYAAVYVIPGSEHVVGAYAEFLPQPRVFEWNILHHNVIERACMDIDGVLCVDPKPRENDDGRRYRRFISDAELRYKPTTRVGTLVTSRLEKYRPETEEWLRGYGIEYEELIMLDLPSAAERRRLQAHVPHKAQAYLASGREIFIESSLHEGRGIYEATGRPVFVTDTHDFFGAAEEVGPSGVRMARARAVMRRSRPLRAVHAVGRRTLGPLRGGSTS